MSQTFDYAEAASDADELIREFGQPGSILATPPRGDWDDADPAPVSYPCQLVVFPIDLQNTGYDAAGTLIKAGDVQILVSVVGLAVTPTTVNQIITANGPFNIIRVNTLAPAGVPVLHDIIGRR